MCRVSLDLDLGLCASSPYSTMEDAFKSLAKEVETYANTLRNDIITYIEKEAFGDIDAKLGHFSDILTAVNAVKPGDNAALEDLLVEIGDALSVMHHEQLGSMVDKMTAHEKAISALIDTVRSCLPPKDTQADDVVRAADSSIPAGEDTCGCYDHRNRT